MSDTMQGRRVEYTLRFPAPGEYYRDPDGRWIGTTPSSEEPPKGHVAHFRRPSVTEHEDGTITVSPAAVVPTPDGEELWRLERGVWIKG